MKKKMLFKNLEFMKNLKKKIEIKNPFKNTFKNFFKKLPNKDWAYILVVQDGFLKSIFGQRMLDDPVGQRLLLGFGLMGFSAFIIGYKLKIIFPWYQNAPPVSDDEAENLDFEEKNNIEKSIISEKIDPIILEKLNLIEAIRIKKQNDQILSNFIGFFNNKSLNLLKSKDEKSEFLSLRPKEDMILLISNFLRKDKNTDFFLNLPLETLDFIINFKVSIKATSSNVSIFNEKLMDSINSDFGMKLIVDQKIFNSFEMEKLFFFDFFDQLSFKKNPYEMPVQLKAQLNFLKNNLDLHCFCINSLKTQGFIKPNDIFFDMKLYLEETSFFDNNIEASCFDTKMESLKVLTSYIKKDIQGCCKSNPYLLSDENFNSLYFKKLCEAIDITASSNSIMLSNYNMSSESSKVNEVIKSSESSESDSSESLEEVKNGFVFTEFLLKPLTITLNFIKSFF